MTVLATGTAGFLGRHVEADIPVTRSDCDLSRPAVVWDLLNRHRPDVVVNCAVVADFGQGVLDRLFPVNTLAPAVIAGWCKANGAHLVQASGSLVHGTRTERITADSPILLDSDYGRSKWLADEAILASGCSATIVRLCGMYGRGGPAHLGLNRAIDAAHRGEAPTVFGQGKARRNYLQVEDAARILRWCADHRLQGVHLAAGPGPVTLAEMFTAVAEIAGTPPVYVDGDEAADQIVEHDPLLPAGRPFRETL